MSRHVQPAPSCVQGGLTARVSTTHLYTRGLLAIIIRRKDHVHIASTAVLDVSYCYRFRTSVCLSVCPSVAQTDESCAKTAESIMNRLGMWTRVGPRNHVLFRPGYHGRHLANTIERSVLGNDAGYRYHYCSNLLSCVRKVKTKKFKNL